MVACENYLDENPPGELAPTNFLTTVDGVEAVLFSAYLDYKANYGQHQYINLLEWPTDIAYQTGGGENRTAVLLINFQWDASTAWINNNFWNQKYQSIRDANTVIENIENLEASDQLKTQLEAEARYIRAVNYAYMYNYYGPVPLRRSNADAPDLPRATDEEMRAFIESELSAVADLLPSSDEQVYGRATQGAALGFLARHYLNTRQWAEAAQVCQDVINLGEYALFTSYRDLFKVENEGDKNPNNREMIAVSSTTNINPYGIKYSNAAFPPNFSYSEKLPEVQWTTDMRNWASQYRLRDAFVDSFDKENDDRFSLIIENYMNRNDALVNLRSSADNSRSMKYFDPNAEIASHGNDWPMLRYADILLMRAEALNELNGPNQESIDLINQVRNRAGLEELMLSDFSSAQELTDHILQERAWEFYSEGLRRDDLLRQGVFISGAQERGITNASERHRLFPIPITEVDANPNMEQNTGY